MKKVMETKTARGTKKLILAVTAVVMCFSISACSINITLNGKKKTQKNGFASSEEAIRAYWKAFSDCKKKEFQEVFPDPDAIKKGKTNIDELIDSSLQQAKAVKDSVVIDLEGIEVETEKYDVDDIDSGIEKAYDIEKAEVSEVVVPLIQTVDGTDYQVEDIYEIITVRIDGKWFVANVEETDVRLLDA
ncbi:MAG: hypothetical protein J5379_09525 [Clostridiales bacterium]|nr:hypothetical protein [Clostridiales bacterium]